MLSSFVKDIKSRMGFDQDEMADGATNKGKNFSDASKENKGLDLDDEFIPSAKIGTRKSLAALRSGSIAVGLDDNTCDANNTGSVGNMLQGLIDYVNQLNTGNNHEIVEIPVNPKGIIGIELEGGCCSPVIPGDTGIFIKSIVPGSVADTKLRVGDRIMSINGVKVEKVSLEEAAKLICKSRGTIRFYVKKSSPRQQLINDVYRAETEVEGNRVFSRRQVEEFEDAFSVYDKQGRGAVKTSSVFKLIRSLGYNPTEAEVWVYMNELGITVNPKMTFHDFVKLMTMMVMEQDHKEELYAAFSVFDKNGDGFFPLKDLEESFHAVSEKMSKRDIRNILRLADPDNDGLVSVKELERLLLPALRMY